MSIYVEQQLNGAGLAIDNGRRVVVGALAVSDQDLQVFPGRAVVCAPLEGQYMAW